MKKSVRLTRFGSFVALMVAFGGFLTAFGADDAVRIYDLPEEDPRCDLYRVSVEGREVPVSAARVSAMPVNIRWPGHQREKDQTEIAGFVRFEMSAPVTMTVERAKAFKDVRIRPYSKNVALTASDRMVTFTLEKPGDYSLEFDGPHENLHIFVYPPSASDVKRDAPNVRYFGPGAHDVGLIEMKSGETLYIDEGAVVHGRVFARDADDISILGRGILDMSRIHEEPIPIDPKLAEEQRRKGFAITNVRRWDGIRLEYCDRVRIDGITMRDSLLYFIRPICCRDIDIRNVKIIGSWRYNADGIDMHNCERVHIADCFVRTYDDAICVKGFDYKMDESEMLHDGYLHDVFRDVLIERCTVWNDWGQSLEFGAETRAREICNVTWRDCDVIRAQAAACDIKNCDYADIHDVLYDDIRLEFDSFRAKNVLSASAKDFDPTADAGLPTAISASIRVIPEYSKEDNRRGIIRDVTFRNIRVTAPRQPAVGFTGYDDQHRVTGVTIKGFFLNGKDITESLRVGLGKFAERPVHVDALDFIDPLIGTEGAGSQYGGMQPYTCVPFGSFHAVPMTRTNRIGRLSFNCADSDLLGIILTRQPAIWMGDWGEVRVEVPPAKLESLDSTPYRTRVTAGGRTYEFTATAHAAWIRGLDAATASAFPASGVNTNRMDAKYGYPLPNFGGRWFADKSRPGELKIGLSLISVEQAKANLECEIGEKSFETVVAEAKSDWESLFGRVAIDAPDDVKTIFYTGLFHTLLYPRQMDEPSFAPSAATEAKARRYYSAFDDKVHEGTRYNCYSLWDTYRAEHPWLTLVAPERVDGMMQSLVDMYREGGWLPKWPNPSYTGIMIGGPAEVVLQEAMAKGFTGFDHDLAKEAIRKNATVPQKFDSERRWEDRGIFGREPETRAGLTSYLARGYVACDETAESVSRTQDFALADRNKQYTNLWCAAEGMFLPRRKDGTFVSRKDLKRPYHDYCEQQPETGVWAVPHDPEGLAELMGGKAEAVRRLDEFFDTLFFKPDGRGNGSIHGNETSHQCAYLYNRFGAPEKTQRRVRQILTKCYSTNRKGFDGNEDCGQMSAWYIFSALGFYPLDPASGFYELGSPLVKGATLTFGAPYPSATLKVVVRNYAPDRWRVKRVTLNGRELSDWRVKHADLVQGGELVFEMCD